ncbi:hypothetical protein MK370_08085 [Streptococcus sanguinis]|uniref:hypothetical protein n=1 Tax=Streptococcus sanguinis TaxID=1305 RepID=UPI0022840DC9|nr:hypothetical protein [Streptococcus sanguinis]MCY7041489.1 hypothetical protein [Streptococcus sanguinis]
MEENKSAAKLREERLLEKQRLAEKARIALLEEKMDERIFELRKTLAQTTDLLIRGDLQVLLNEEEQKREIYYEKKQLAESQAQQIQLAVDKTLEEQLVSVNHVHGDSWAKKESEENELAAKLNKQNSHSAGVDLEDRLRWRQESKRDTVFISTCMILSLLCLVFIIYKNAINAYRTQIATVQASSSQIRDTKNQEEVVEKESSTNVQEKQNSPTLSSSVASVPVNYQVQVDIDNLIIREKPALNGKDLGFIEKGIYTITETVQMDGHLWGRVKSGKGWIALDYTTKVTKPSSADSSESSISNNSSLYKEWAGYYVNWTSSIRYVIKEDGTGSMITSGGETLFKVKIEEPSQETKVWGLVLDDNGAPQEPKEYVANIVITLISDNDGMTRKLYGVLLKNNRRELTFGEYTEHKNSVYRK